MTIVVGDRVPAGKLQTMRSDEVVTLTTAEIFDGKRVVMFAVPGAFTPACSATHLPGFLLRIDEIKAKNVDTVACLAVNDDGSGSPHLQPVGRVAPFPAFVFVMAPQPPC